METKVEQIEIAVMLDVGTFPALDDRASFATVRLPVIV